jgi:hypothetical protein
VHVIDLAGSERQSATGAAGERIHPPPQAMGFRGEIDLMAASDDDDALDRLFADNEGNKAIDALEGDG